VDDVRLMDGEELPDYPMDAETINRRFAPPVARIVSRVTTWSDGTVHIERPGEATFVVAPVERA
jgi:hypothetical protein